MVRRDQFTRADRWLAGLTGAAIFAQLTRFAKYTPLTPKQVVRRSADPEWLVSILTANVRMRNQSADRLLSLVKRREPDLVLLMETDERWARQVESLHASYPHRVVRPLDNTYGIILYSRLPLVEPRVRFLVQEDIPSIQTRVRLRNGREFWFYGVHPRPPARGNVDGEIELPGSAPRDAELVVVAMEIRDLHEPVIVAGDFNDVAWSHTTRRFQRLSRTLDPRVGRGLYSTFHAGNRLLRFPLDHLFISEHFAVNEFIREGDIGSDHFPLYARLVMDPSVPAVQEPPESQEDDFQEAQETLEAAAEQKSEHK
jgi:endonuclease/exonuclease/phosphatase (EEP) superfamily protein YafD